MKRILKTSSKAAWQRPKNLQNMRKRVNNDNRRIQYDRYGKYCLAAERIGIQIPKRHLKDLDAAVIWLGKQPDIWWEVRQEAARLFPDVFKGFHNQER